uniref:Uncharacterized protein n=1 Tax=Arundo donax TaxID=35708 RepID=A0A0A9FDJ6_ARUDO
MAIGLSPAFSASV